MSPQTTCPGSEGNPFLTIKCVEKGGGFNREGLKYYRGIFGPDQVVRRGDLVMALTDLTRAGDIVGSPVRVPDFGDVPVLPSMDLAILRRNDEDVDLDFLFYRLMLHDARRYMLAHSAGTTVLHLESRSIPKFKFRSPKTTVQARIAGVLATIDEAIEQTEALIAKTQQIKAGLMHELFTRGVTTDGRLRLPRDDAPKLYKESPLGWIPKEWEAGRLADKRGTGRPHLKTGPFGSSLKLEHWVEEGRPVITIGALGEGEFIAQELLYVAETTAERLREYQLQVGDVVFSRVADVGRSAAICDGQEGWIMSSNLMRISLDRRLVVPAFLQAQLAYDTRLRRQIRATVNAGGRDVANSQILNRLNFAWPPKDEQERVVARLEGLEDYRRSNVIRLEKLRLEKAGLMHDLLTGRVPVPIGEAQTDAGNV